MSGGWASFAIRQNGFTLLLEVLRIRQCVLSWPQCGQGVFRDARIFLGGQNGSSLSRRTKAQAWVLTLGCPI